MSEIQVITISLLYVYNFQQFWRAGYGQIIRVVTTPEADNATLQHVEIVHEIGPLDLGKELVTRFTTNLNNNEVIYTDDNGLEIQTRTYNATEFDLVSGNYFPMVQRAYMVDTTKNLQV